MNIIIGGDFYPNDEITKTNEEKSFLFDEKVIEYFSNSDLNIINLECPLTNADETHKIIKTGPHLKANPETVNVLKGLNVDIVTLANNHIFDYGEKGLDDTLRTCENAKIKTVGAGKTRNSASKILYINKNSITVSIVNFAENEWSNVSDEHGGANSMDIIENVRSILEAKQNSDIVLVIIHGGHELYHYPSPRMVKQYRFYAEQGASAIIGHHTHCVSGYEEYKNVPIFYSTGNFFFPSVINFSGWYEGYLVSFNIDKNKKLRFDIIPYNQCKSNRQLFLLNEEEKEIFDNKIILINKIINDKKKLQIKFDEFIGSKQRYYITEFSTSQFFSNKYIIGALKRLKLEKIFIRKRQLRSILNLVRCESHRDMVFNVLKKYL